MLYQESYAGYAINGGLSVPVDPTNLSFRSDGALADIDLADGATDPRAIAWLRARGIPSLFVTRQEDIAERYSGLTRGVIAKPIATPHFADKLTLLKG